MGLETPGDPRVALLVRLIDEGFDAKAWHGPTLRGGLRRLDAEAAAWRPAPDKHNVWEIALHAAYWKYAVLRRITGQARGSFPLKGSNWFTRPDPDLPREEWQAAWEADLKLLDRTHVELRAAVAAFDPARLDAPWPGSKHVPEKQIIGVALHDVYHAGQIRQLKRAGTTAGGKTRPTARKLKREK